MIDEDRLKIAGDGDGESQINTLKTLAEQGGAIAAVLMNVPNQPLYEDRREDALIAYSFSSRYEACKRSLANGNG